MLLELMSPTPKFAPIHQLFLALQQPGSCLGPEFQPLRQRFGSLVPEAQLLGGGNIQLGPSYSEGSGLPTGRSGLLSLHLGGHPEALVQPAGQFVWGPGPLWVLTLGCWARRAGAGWVGGTREVLSRSACQPNMDSGWEGLLRAALAGDASRGPWMSLQCHCWETRPCLETPLGQAAGRWLWCPSIGLGRLPRLILTPVLSPRFTVSVSRQCLWL